MINIFAPIISIVFGFLLGSIPNGMIIAKVFFHKDPRQYGSGNVGGTNVGRMLGKRFGLLTIILDMAKSAIAVYAVWAVVTFVPNINTALKSVNFCSGRVDMASLSYWIAALGAAVGHCWTPWLKFKGGKAAGSMMGMTTMTSWYGFVLGGFYLGTLKLKKMVSLSSIVGGAAQAVGAWVIAILQMTGVFTDLYIFSYTFVLKENAVTMGLWYAIAVTLVEIILIYRHASNIKRMQQHTESHITWMK
ncbi:MAG: glycerol-3-phosphate acyltransferase [Bacilli bacterium]|nr:glycerol-3-phosphate acyltransferase [Bacilli bacterium]